MTEGQRWYTADHYDTDSEYHTYCGTCFDQIPDWLIRWSSEKKAPFITGGEPSICDGCGKVANNNTDTTK